MEGLLLFFFACVFSGTLIPMPEDVAVLAAGATVEDPMRFLALALVGIAGLLCRDGAFFFIGHFAGEGVFRWSLVRRIVGDERIAKGRSLVEERGGRAVLISRFMVGVRATGFLASGAMGVKVRDFFFWDLVGLAVSVPLMLGLGFALGEPIQAVFQWIIDHKSIVLFLVVLGVGVWLVSLWRRGAPPAEPAVED